jgi:hypothetical protein
MARYLSNINLTGNQLQNALLHPTGTEPTALGAGQVYFNTGNSSLYVYDGSSWINVSGDISEVVAGSGLTGGGASGSVTLNIGQGDGITVSAASIAVNAEPSQFSFASGVLTISTGAIGADELTNTGVTAGSYGDGSNYPTFTVDADGRITAASSVAISTSFNIAGDTGTDTVNTGETLTFSGTTGEIVTTVTNNEVTIGLPNDVTIGNNLIVSGNLTVSGTVTTINTETINLADNIITLNSNATGSATQNGGIEINRGDDTDVSFIWNETSDRWTFTNDGSTFYNIPIPSEYDNFSFSVSDGSVTQEVANAGTITFAQGGGLTVAVSGDDTVTYTHADTSSVTDISQSGLNVIQDIGFDTYGHVTSASATDITSDVDGRITAREYAVSIGDGTTTAYTVTHNLNTRDVIVQLFDNSSYDTVYADVERTTVNTLTVTFATAPTSNDIRVLVTKIG